MAEAEGVAVVIWAVSGMGVLWILGAWGIFRTAVADRRNEDRWAALLREKPDRETSTLGFSFAAFVLVVGLCLTLAPILLPTP